MLYDLHIDRSADSSGTYGLMMEYSNAGMMRRTAVDFSLATANEKISLTQVNFLIINGVLFKLCTLLC